MKEIVQFLDAFMEAEILVLKRFLQPDLEEYNKAVDAISQFTVKELEDGFGAKITRLKRPSYYERVKKYAPPTKRFIFRIDEHKINEEKIYQCFLSKANPNNYKSYFSDFIVGFIEGQPKILASYVYSDKGMGGEKRFYFHGGISNFNTDFGQYQILNTQILGELIKITRLMEPSDDQASMKEYLKE